MLNIIKDIKTSFNKKKCKSNCRASHKTGKECIMKIMRGKNVLLPQERKLIGKGKLFEICLG